MQTTPAVALLIDNRKNTKEDIQEAMTVTALGRVEQVEDFERSIMEKNLFNEAPVSCGLSAFP